MAQKVSGKKAMGAIGSPVVLVTASHNGRNGIMAVNMVAGLSFSPPLIGVSLSTHSFTRSLIDDSGVFCVNIISPQQLDLVKAIGSSTGHKIDKFKEFGIDTSPATSVSCLVVKDAHTILECTAEKSIDIGKQVLYIGRVTAYHGDGESEPLYLYHGKYYTLGEEIGVF